MSREGAFLAGIRTEGHIVESDGSSTDLNHGFHPGSSCRALRPGRDLYVYLMEGDNKVTVRPIKTGETDGTNTVVVSGLKPEDRVVTDGTDRLKDGAPVRITEGAQAAVGDGKAAEAKPDGTGEVKPGSPADGTAEPQGTAEGGRRHRRRQAQ